MKERPILFSAPMVRAILEGRKTQTRRVVKPMSGAQKEWLTDELLHGFVQSGEMIKGGWQMWHPKGGLRSPLGWIRCPYGVPGDRLWVRETHAIINGDPYDAVLYRETPGIYYAGRWRPSIHMPRWASRITLEIKSISVERLQDISEEDVWAEGWYEIAKGNTDFENFGQFWESINGPGSWDANPWVWKIEFDRTTAGGNE